jgi:hypothetical protein
VHIDARLPEGHTLGRVTDGEEWVASIHAGHRLALKLGTSGSVRIAFEIVQRTAEGTGGAPERT